MLINQLYGHSTKRLIAGMRKIILRCATKEVIMLFILFLVELYFSISVFKPMLPPTSVPIHIEYLCSDCMGVGQRPCNGDSKCCNCKSDDTNPRPTCCLRACCDPWDNRCNVDYWTRVRSRCEHDWLPWCDDAEGCWTIWGL